MLRDLNHSDWQFLDVPEVGVLGANVPLIGEHGGSVLANEGLTATKYYRAQIKTAPASGTLTLYMNGSGSLSGASAGQYTLEYYVWENGRRMEDADNIAIATFNVGNWSSPAGIAPITAFGIPTYSQGSYDQTSTPDGIASTTAIGTPTAYLSTGLQTSTPTGIASTTAVGSPSYTLSSAGWVSVLDPSSGWTEVTYSDNTWTEET